MKSQLQKDEEKDKGVISTTGNNTEHVPLDLTIEILTRLPAKSLLRFRCVSKQWCSIITSGSFINSYMSRSRPRLSVLYSVHPRHSDYMLFDFSSSLHHQESNHSSSTMVSNHDSEISSATYVVINSSIRGIHLISLDHHYFAICNPTTRQVIMLPKDSNAHTCYVFLGYNPSNDEYKILRKMTREQDGPAVHSVCTLVKTQESSFSPWRHVECNFSYSVLRGNVVCINGVMYYGAATKSTNPFVVMSFDVGSEQLRLIQVPEEGHICYRTLVNYHGKVACFSANLSFSSFVLWVLDDAKNQIWSTKNFAPSPSFYDLNLTLGNSTVCGITDAGEMVFVARCKNDDIEILCYDLEKNKVRRRFRPGGSNDYDEFRCPLDGFRYSSSYLHRCITISCDHVDNITLF